MFIRMPFSNLYSPLLLHSTVSYAFRVISPWKSISFGGRGWCNVRLRLCPSLDVSPCDQLFSPRSLEIPVGGSLSVHLETNTPLSGYLACYMVEMQDPSF